VLEGRSQRAQSRETCEGDNLGKKETSQEREKTITLCKRSSQGDATGPGTVSQLTRVTNRKKNGEKRDATQTFERERVRREEKGRGSGGKS